MLSYISRWLKKYFWIIFAIISSALLYIYTVEYFQATTMGSFNTVGWDFKEEGFKVEVKPYKIGLYDDIPDHVSTSDRMCLNITIINENKYWANVSYYQYLADYRFILDEDREKIFANLDSSFMFTPSLPPVSNMRTNYVCTNFNNAGHKIFYVGYKMENDTTTKRFATLTGVPVRVISDEELRNIIDKRRFDWILALTVIPVVLSSVKVLRDLYRSQ